MRLNEQQTFGILVGVKLVTMVPIINFKQVIEGNSSSVVGCCCYEVPSYFFVFRCCCCLLLVVIQFYVLILYEFVFFISPTS